MTKKRPATAKRRRQRKDGGFVKTAPTGARRTKPKDPVTKALKADFDATPTTGG